MPMNSPRKLSAITGASKVLDYNFDHFFTGPKTDRLFTTGPCHVPLHKKHFDGEKRESNPDSLSYDHSHSVVEARTCNYQLLHKRH